MLEVGVPVMVIVPELFPEIVNPVVKAKMISDTVGAASWLI